MTKQELIDRWETKEGQLWRLEVLRRIRAGKDWPDDLQGINLQCEVLRGVHLDYANLSYANLNGCDLTKVGMTCTILIEASLVGAILVDAMLTQVNAERALFDHARLTRAYLNCARCRWASFRGAILVETDISRADFRDTIRDGWHARQIDDYYTKF